MKNWQKLVVGWIPGLTLLLVAMPTTAEPAPPTCTQTHIHADAPEETSQFGFLVGDFKVTLHAWQAGAWTPPRPVNARWNGWYGLNGMAIVDEWYDPDPAVNPNGGSGINVRLYDPDQAVWKMMWISTGGKQVQDLRAKVIDGQLTMWQVNPPRPDFRAVFEVTDKDHWSRISYVPKEGDSGEVGEEWVPQFKLAASRIPCVSR